MSPQSFPELFGANRRLPGLTKPVTRAECCFCLLEIGSIHSGDFQTVSTVPMANIFQSLERKSNREVQRSYWIVFAAVQVVAILKSNWTDDRFPA